MAFGSPRLPFLVLTLVFTLGGILIFVFTVGVLYIFRNTGMNDVKRETVSDPKMGT